MRYSTSRREFMKKAFALAVAVPAARLLSGGFSITTAFAAAKLPPLPAGKTAVPDADPVGNALGYKHFVSQVDKKKYPQYKAGQDCATCSLYIAEDKNWGKCQMLQNGLVHAKGWCGSFNKKV